MGVIRLDGAPCIEVQLRKSARARRLSLRVSSLDGRVTLTVPRGVSETEARDFAKQKQAWIMTARGRVPDARSVALAESLPVAGVERRIAQRSVRAAALEGDVLILPIARPGPAAKAFLRLRAQESLSSSVARYSGLLDVRPAALSLRDTRSRWGSCTAQGRLMFSWRLAMAPVDVLDYVAAHEVAHLVHMDHSPAFWSVVERLRPDWRAARDWLRGQGTALHAIRFED